MPRAQIAELRDKLLIRDDELKRLREEIATMKAERAMFRMHIDMIQKALEPEHEDA